MKGFLNLQADEIAGYNSNTYTVVVRIAVAVELGLPFPKNGMEKPGMMFLLCISATVVVAGTCPDAYVEKEV